MSECPPLTTIPPDAIAISVDQFFDLLVSTYNRTVGTSVTVRCRGGLQLQGPSTVMCMANNNWNVMPECIVPPTTTTVSPVQDRPAVLISMVVVILFVCLVIGVIVALLCRDRFKRKKEKLAKELDDYNLEDMSGTPCSNDPGRSGAEGSSNYAMDNVHRDTPFYANHQYPEQRYGDRFEQGYENRPDQRHWDEEERRETTSSPQSMQPYPYPEDDRSREGVQYPRPRDYPLAYNQETFLKRGEPARRTEWVRGRYAEPAQYPSGQHNQDSRNPTHNLSRPPFFIPYAQRDLRMLDPGSRYSLSDLHIPRPQY